MNKHRRLSVALIATCLSIGLVAAPSASAAGSDGGAKAKASVTKKKLNRDLRKVRTRTTRAARAIRTMDTALKALDALAKGADGKANTILAGVPDIVNGLTALRDGSLQLKTGLETAGAGLTALKTAVETQIAPGLASAGTALKSTEYGFGQVIVGATPQAGSFVVTPDIPDTVQQAQTTQQFVAQNAGPITVAYGVRSAENDGTGAALPAALCKVTVTNEAGDTDTTAGNAGIGGLPFQPVETKSALTSTTPANAGFPFGLKTDNTANDADVTTPFASGVSVANPGDTYTVGLSCVDTSPDANNPAA